MYIYISSIPFAITKPSWVYLIYIELISYEVLNLASALLLVVDILLMRRALAHTITFSEIWIVILIIIF